ncbi:FKBP-type peptidyl-prolyl cis-trans isomerase [Microbacterium sp. C7(2022)]|uniref:FKBP-type peptidyl-prolyl cis-trans isomerase n=1 Tax=Microbacterium sp. C7(2022) TaxID=2992759 RepID=UPI00237C2F7C|nr:FKBP-type peptidyl-prolyl cis-trans isomerase [Microbacterium sp. C7(2022)]MDE0547205.1 FKBP-type peptidyl-prolyl cis-trans isomerase [Microbacterium sp. C7(2022)]
MRIRPLAAASIAALSVAVLAGCTASDTEADPTSTGDAAGDLCAAAVASGSVSDSLTVEGEVGEASTLSFDAPLEVEELQRTVVVEGSGDPVSDGDLVSYALTVYSAETGDEIGSFGYDDSTALPQQITADNPLGQLFGCATPGTRVVAAFPASDDGAAAEVYILDLLSVVPAAAWGEPQEPVAGMPTVELDESGAPTITIPDEEPPTDVEIAELKVGGGEVVAEGDSVMVQYTGVKWSDGTVFDSSWDRGAPTSFSTSGVVAGFSQALVGQTVGSQVLVVIPPEFGYGASDGHELQDETIVFVVDILGTQHAA